MKKAIVPLCLLIVIGLAIVVYINRFINYSIVEVDGYAFTTNALATNLAKAEEEENISVEKVEVSDIIYKSNKKFYVGEEKKKNITLDYPIISKDTSSIYIASSVGDLITEDFSHEVAYAGSIVTDAKLYNTIDYEQATDYSYMFVQLNNGIYVNTKEFNIKTYLENTTIPVNSFIRFNEKSINYYYLINDKFIYESLPIIDSNDKVTIGDFEGTYNKFLINMGIIRDPSKNDENITGDENGTGNNTSNGEIGDGEISSEVAESKPEYIKKESKEKEEKKYVAPEVSISGTYAKTYSYRGVLNISDPSAAISKSPVFEFSINGSVALRKSVNSKGPFKISGLLPSTKYTVTAYYEYFDESGKKRQKKIMFNNKEYSDTFTTESIDNLNDLEFSFGDISADTNSFLVKSIKFKNDIEDEVLNGIKGVSIKTNESTFIFTNSDLKYLLNLIDLDYSSAKILKSNTEYNAKFIVTDTAGNVLRTKNDTFSFKTKQKAPVAKINIAVSKNFTKAEAKFNITNVDNVEVSKYYYNVYDDNNNLFGTGQIFDGQDEYTITGLDTAKRYVVKVFSNYKTNDGYTFNDVEIGSIDFISFDIEKLGNIQFVVDLNSQREDYLTDHSASINVAYLNYDANDPLFDLLDNQVKLNIVNHETGEVEYTGNATKYDFIASSNYDIGYGEDIKLKSNTLYDLKIDASVTSGTNVIPIRTTINSKGFSFTTLKKEAYVSVTNLFIASGYIDFDAYVVDPDSAILDKNEETAENIKLEIYNKSKEKIYSEVLNVTHSDKNEEMINNRITINSLENNNEYEFIFKADSYNDNMNSDSDKKLLGSNNFYITGLSANIDIQEMIKTVNFYHQPEDNLFDVTDITRWKSTLNSSFNITEKMSISDEGNTITLGAYNGYRVYSYYLPELIGQDIVLSFKGKRGTDREGQICIMNSVSNNVKNCVFTLDLDENYQEFNNLSFKLNNTGYISFYIAETDNEFYTNSIVLKDFQIEVGTESSEYKKYNSGRGYIGTFNTNAKIRTKPEVENPEMTVNQGNYDYFVSLIKDDVRTEDEVFETDNGSFEDENGIENKQEFSDIVKDSHYKVAFSVYDKDLERYYDLDVVNFETDSEIRVIKNTTDFLNMHKAGHYAAVADLDFRNISSVYSGTFSGTLDMQGHKIILGTSNRTYLIHTLGGGGVVKNADIHYYLNNTTGKRYNWGIVYDNYGIIENFMMTIEESTNVSNYDWAFMSYRNFGIYRNFVIRSKAPIHGFRSMTLGALNNYGTIKNGYVFADETSIAGDNPDLKGYSIDVSQNIPTIDNSNKNTGIMAVSTSAGSIIENIYITSKIYIGENPEPKDKVVGTVAGSVSSATIRNIYVYDDTSPLDNTRDTSLDIMFGKTSNINYSNMYYISEVEYANTYSKTQQLTALKNVKFQDNTINSENMFLTDKSWRLNIFPLLKLPECMPKQEYITIPSISGEDLKFLAVDDIEYLDGDYSAKIAISFYNPKGLVIRGVNIDGIGTVDLSGKPSTNSDKITTAILKLKNPSAYKSYYTLSSVTVNSGTIDMNAQMAMDLYLEVSSVSAITDMNTNYRLVADVDCNVDKCKKLGTYYGKLNGSGHTISNLRTNDCFINYLRGTLENINFDDFENTKTNVARVGIVCTLDSNGDIKDVHSENSVLTAYSNNGTAYVGGLVGYVNNGTISNSSVNNLKIVKDYLINAIPNIGGLVGYGSNIIIDTSLARNIKLESTSLPADTSGIGGIIGVFASGKISNVYSTGRIQNNTQYLGGIAGRITGSTAAINSAISKVDINADQDYIGGINGYTVATNTISQTIVLNNLSTVKDDAEFYDRTSGTSINRSANFAWDKQSLNNIITKDTNGEQLLTQEDLWNPVIYSSKVGFGAAWALENNFHSGYIPYLKSSDDKIIRGQGFYEDENQTQTDLRIYYEELFKLHSYSINKDATVYLQGHENDSYYAKQYKVDIYIENAHNYYIKSLVIDGLRLVSVDMGSTPESDNITHMRMIYEPIKYLDNYVISEIVYEDENRDEQRINVNMVLNLPFFGIIRNKDDWANIERNYYENYIIENDIDLSGLTKEQIYGKSFNRLVGYPGERTKIMNAKLETNKVGESLIDTIVTEIKNIEFNNTSIKNTANGDYSGIIKYLNGSMSNMNFINTKIDVPKIRYAGVVSINQAPEIRNIYVDDMEISGKTYVGFIGKSKSLPVTSVTLKNVYVDATSTYVGGLIGYENWKERGVYTSFVVGDNVNINQRNTTYGNYVGGIFGYGSGNDITIANSHVKGNERVGGISGEHSNRYIYYNYVYNTEVEGNTYVGGAAGRNQVMYGSLVYYSNIHGTSQVGGVSGACSGLSINGCGSVGNTITGTEYVGGIMGYMGSTSLSYDFVRNTSVTGENYVGGILGSTSVTDNTIQYCVSNATVKATNANAGGVIGYIKNLNTTTSRYRTRIWHDIIAGSSITTNDFGGGIVGKTDVGMYKDQFHHLFVNADIKCDAINCGYINGTDDTYSTAISRLFIYEDTGLIKNGTRTPFKNSTQNATGSMFGSGTKSAIATYAQIKTNAFWKSTMAISNYSYDANSVTTVYPRPNYAQIQAVTIPDTINMMPTSFVVTYKLSGDSTKTMQEFSALPMPTIAPTFNTLGSGINEYHELPNAAAYVSSIDTINIDFDFIDEDSKLVLDDKEYPIDRKTVTFKYDFNNDLVFKITDGNLLREFNYSKNDIMNSISVLSNNYYHIKDNHIITNDSEINISNAVNLFDNKVLLDNGNIYDIDNKETIDNAITNYQMIDVIPLYEFEYLDETIKTFYNYSLVNDEYYEGQLFVKDGELDIIDSEIYNKKDRIIIDKFNNKNYLLYLDNGGSLHSLKDNIKYPDEFYNINIKDINTNINTSTDLLFVLYQDGNYIVFNYKTGTLIDRSVEVKPSLASFIKLSYSLLLNTPSLDEPVDLNYKETQKLISKLNDASIEDVLQSGDRSKNDIAVNPNGTKAKYTIKYNPKTEEYDVIEVKVESEDSIVTQLTSPTVQEVIKNNEILSDYYNMNFTKKSLSATSMIQRLIFILFGVIILASIVILGDLVIKKIKVRS